MSPYNLTSNIASKLFDYLEPSDSMYVSFKELNENEPREYEILENYLLMAAKLISELEPFKFPDPSLLYLLGKVTCNNY